MLVTHWHFQTELFFFFDAISGVYHVYVQFLFVLEGFSFQWNVAQLGEGLVIDMVSLKPYTFGEKLDDVLCCVGSM